MIKDASQAVSMEGWSVRLELIKNLIRRRAFILTEQPGLVFQELHNNLRGEAIRDSSIEQLLEKARAKWTAPWLCNHLGSSEIPELLHVLTSHRASVLTVSFSLDGTRLLSADLDGVICVSSVETGRELARFSGLAGAVTQAEFSPDGRRIAVLREVNPRWTDATESALLDAASGTVLSTRTYYEQDRLEACAFSPLGDVFAMPNSASAISILDARTGESRVLLETPPGTVLVSAFDEIGRHLSAVLEEGLLLSWNLATGALLRRSDLWRGEKGRSAALSPGGGIIAAGHENGDVSLWTEDGWCVARRSGHSGAVIQCVFSAGTDLLLTASARDGLIRIWDGRTLEERGAVENGVALRRSSITADGLRLVTGETLPAFEAFMWDARNGLELACLSAHTFEIQAVALSPDGRHAASASSDGTVILWDSRLAEQRSPRRPTGIRAVSFGPEIGTLAAIGPDIFILDVATGETISRLGERSILSWGSRFGPAGRFASVIYGEGKNGDILAVWDLAARALRLKRRLPSSAGECWFDPDGRLVIWAPEWNGNLTVIDILRRKEITAIPGRRIHKDMDNPFTPDGRLFLYNEADRSLELWDLRTCARREIVGSLDSAPKLVCSPDGQMVALNVPKWRIIDFATGQDVLSPADGMSSLNFSPDGRFLAAVRRSDDNSDLSLEAGRPGASPVIEIGLWTLPAFDPFRTIRFSSDMESSQNRCLFSPDGRWLIWASDEKIRLFGIENSRELFFRDKAGGLNDFAMSPDSLRFLVGNRRGDVLLFSLENVAPGPPLATAFHRDGNIQFRCVWCYRSGEIAPSLLGTECACSLCGRIHKINPFVFPLIGSMAAET